MSSPWPEPSPREVFAARRQRLVRLHPEPILLASGFARARNLPDNRYPFRAESHFLYLVGESVEGAALYVDGGRWTLFVQPPDPAEALWTGAVPSFEELGERLGLDVRSIDELEPRRGVATLPPQDADTALWLASFVGRDIEAGGGDEVQGADARLADAMIELRLRHDRAAVEQIRQAVAVSALAHREGMRVTKPGIREAAVRAAMERGITASGMGVAYPPIVTVHGEVLHNERYDGELAPSDLVLADVGAETPEGWASDVTRTWPVRGRFSGAQRALYEAVLAVQRDAIRAIAPGVRFLEVHRLAGRRLIEELVALGILRGDPGELYARGAAALFFPHGVGHLLGLDVHDLEDLGDRAGYAPGRRRPENAGDRYLRLDRDLEPGMVVTIEPGFYQVPAILAELGSLADAVELNALKRFSDVRGIRIEDDVLVTENGAEVLSSNIPKSPDDIQAVMS